MKEYEIIQIRMYMPTDGSTFTYDVSEVSKNRYQLFSNNPISEVLIYGTIIDVQPEKKIEEEETFIFKEVYSESEFNLEVIGLPMSLNETEMRVVGQMIINEGGHWEVIFGGMGYVNLPKNSKLNVIAELNKIIKTKNNNK